MKGTLGLVALATAPTPLAALAQDDQITIAYLASSSLNGFNRAIHAGIVEAAATHDNVRVEIFDGEFSAPVQFSQVEDLIAGGRFDAMIVTPIDTRASQPRSRMRPPPACVSGPPRSRSARTCRTWNPRCPAR